MTGTTSQSIFPDYPRENPVLDQDGRFMPLWDLGLGSLFQALQENFKNEGILFPALTAAQMANIQALYAPYVSSSSPVPYQTLTMNLPDISGQTVYDDDTYTTNQFVIAKDSATPPNVVLAQWVPLSVMLTNAGAPSGAVAGVLNWLCYDTTGKHLYICTGTGNTTTATWQQV